MHSGNKQPFVLGIDLGVTSLGWACLELSDGSPAGIIGTGVRIFEAGVEGDVEQGKDSSRAAVRRQKRSPRRQIERRSRRQRKIFRILQRHGLMPTGLSVDQAQIDSIVAALDTQLIAEHVKPNDRVGASVWPYRLRARALNQRLEPHALGRAIYHLAQRRGFLSNRKTDKGDEEEGKVKAGIAELSKLMAASNARTLGEYFASLDPESLRIRQRWTARDMYTDEFESIWAAQSKHAPDLLTQKLKRRIEQAMFRQRPLKSASHLIGRCELEPKCRRASLASTLAQRFRLLAAVNNLVIFNPDGTKTGLSADQRTKLIDALELNGDITFDQVRKLLGLKKTRNHNDKTTGQNVTEPGHSFNLEEGGEKKIPGNRTSSKLIPIFGDRWAGLSQRQQDEIVQDLLEYHNSSALADRAMRRWSLSEEAAEAFSRVRLEQDYARFSRRALERLVPRMEEGLPYMTARKDEYPGSLEAKPARDSLPPVLDAIKELRNPAVCRSLTELRKVVNAIVRKYGKPDLIRIELARDLKQPRKQREQNWKRNRDREDERETAAHKIKAARLVVGEPNRDAVEKWLLADECNWLCPYSGKVITPESLLGKHPQFDVEHIVPFGTSLDNTFINKTLCDTHFNRHRKMNRLPAECFDRDGDEWHEVIQRVRRFNGKAASIKLERFQWTTVPDDFTNRHLQDTRYASRLAGEYVGLLYGGGVDQTGTRRVQVSAGGVTAFLRNEWGMNGILDDGGVKTREDHRHHAVDALTIAMTSPSAVKMLSDAATKAPQSGRRRFQQVPEPWVGFLDQLREAVHGIKVSHRTNHRVNGPLHEETNYSKPHAITIKGKPGHVHHVRKPLASLSTNEVEDIVDDRIRALVKAKLDGGEPKKVFADGANLPALPTKSGQAIPIKRVRIRKSVTTIAVGSPKSPRYVAPGSNHHMAIVAVLDDKGNEIKWEGHLVSRFEAMQRVRRGEPVVQTNWGNEKQFRFSISGGDCLAMPHGQTGQSPVLFTVANISARELELRSNSDARAATTLRKTPGARRRETPENLRRAGAFKVIIDPMGNVFPCND